jgi:nucleotide-binding universal stress UspA family protein
MVLTNIRIKKILFATDLSESAAHAFSYAVSLANVYGAGITILHVLTEFPGEQFVSSMINTETWREIKKRHYSDAREKLIGKSRDYLAMKEILTAFAEQVKAKAEDQTFVTDDILIESGEPSETIIETAKEQNCDLIVMATHGRGAIADVLIGSTAKRVVRNSPIPVLVIRRPEQDA